MYANFSFLSVSTIVAQQPPIVAYYNASYSNQGLPPEVIGVCDDVFFSATTGMNLFANGKVVDSKQYLYSATINGALLILDELSEV